MHFARYSYIYGSLSSLIVVMLWLYACMEILLVGAGVNTLWARRVRVFKG
jgi:membrane protein